MIKDKLKNFLGVYTQNIRILQLKYLSIFKRAGLNLPVKTNNLLKLDAVWDELAYSPLKWFCVLAFLLHLILTITIHLVGKFQLLPNYIDSNGIITFASDSKLYLSSVSVLAKLLKSGALNAWWEYPATFNSKLYSISFAIFSPLFGDSLLSAEPLNLSFYLIILLGVYVLGRMLFNQNAGLIAAIICALFPSLLLHTTQILRDQLFLSTFLILVILLVLLQTKKISLYGGAFTCACATFVLLILWHNRWNQWTLINGVIFLGFFTMLIGLIIQRKPLIINTLVCLFLVASLWLIPAYFPLKAAFVKTASEKSIRNGFSQNVMQEIALRRKRFQERYVNASSTLDTEIKIETFGELIAYSPNALSIGLFAPFPRMWFMNGGASGRSARLLSGAETLFMYFLNVFALCTIWRHRKRTDIWFIFLIILAAGLAFGLIVTNIGALYRMRYCLWILTIILAADSLCFFGSLYRQRFSQSKIKADEVID